jgi:glycosyltransferase involved in cell wall biosynthesis
MFVDKPLPTQRPTGVGIAAYNMAAALSRRQVMVWFVCRGNSNSITRVNDFLEIRTVRNFSRSIRKATEPLRKEGVRLTHVHSAAALPAVLLSRFLGVPAITHFHEDWPLHPIRPALMRRLSANLSQRVFAASERSKQDLVIHHLIDPSKISVIYNGVDQELFKPLEKEESILEQRGIPRSENLILSVGAVNLLKGQRFVIECLPRIQNEYRDVVYVNAGRANNPSYLYSLLARARELGVAEKVKFLGSVPQEDLVKLINSATIIVHPSVKESFPLAVLEAMACGMPVIAFDVGGIPEVISNEIDGLILQPSEVELERAITRVLGDTALQKSLGARARAKVVAEFTWVKTADHIRAVYGQLATR